MKILKENVMDVLKLIIPVVSIVKKRLLIILLDQPLI